MAAMNRVMVVTLASAVGVLLGPAPIATAVHPGVRVVCITGSTQSGQLLGKYRYKPRKCLFLKERRPTTAGTTLLVKRMRWKSWSGRRARAVGIASTNDGHHRVRVRLLKPHHPCGDQVFTRAKFKSRGSHWRQMPLNDCLV